MQKELSITLLNKIKDAPYLDRSSGLVQTFEDVQIDRDTGKVIARKKFAVSSFATFQDCVDKPQPSVAMIPDSHYKSLLYFEDGGVQSSVPGARGMEYTSRLRLVCWLNTSLISGMSDMQLSAIVMSDIIGKLTGEYFNDAPFARVKVTVSGIPTQDKSIFSKYDYNEAQTQYLMPPFEYFAIDLNISFMIPNGCIAKIETTTQDPCSTPNQVFHFTQGNGGSGLESNNLIEVKVVAGEAIGSPRVVMISDGQAFLFDPTNEDNIYKQIGVSRTSANQGDIITIVLDGSFNTGGNVVQDSVYFAGNNGLLVTDPPNIGILLNIGLAKDNNFLIVNKSSPYILI